LSRDERLPNRYDIERAVERSGLPPIGRHILLFLATRMQQGSTLIPREYSPSLTVIAAATAWDRRTIMRQLNILEELGWLIRHRPDPYLARTRHARTAYTVTPPGLGAETAQARDTLSRGLGAETAQARDTLSRGLGAGDPAARGRAPHNQTASDQPDQSGEDLIDVVVKQLLERTGTEVSREWAATTRDLLLARPGIKNPRAYIIRTVATDPRPERWLPTPQPPNRRTKQKEDS
jgi:DNA-binding MarR family transcriptional regulator